MNNKNIIWVLVTVIILILGVVAVGYLNQPDDRNALQRLGDAAKELPSLEDAASQLEDQSPIERLGNEIEDATAGNGQ